MSPFELEAKNLCAGEGQQEFSSQSVSQHDWYLGGVVAGVKDNK
jgi:hypothetical protein